MRTLQLIQESRYQMPILNKFFLIALSSLLWFLSLHTFGYCAFLILFMLTPLFVIIQRNQSCSFGEGFVWAFIFFSAHFHCFFFMSHSSAFFISPLLLVVYMGSLVGVCFWVLHVISLHTRYKNTVWVLGFNGLFFIINYGSGFFVEVGSGYCLMHPVIALVQLDFLVSLTQQFPRELLLACIIAVSYCAALCIARRSLLYGLCAIALIGCFFGSSFYYPQPQPMITITYVQCAPLHNPIDQATMLIEKINQCAFTCDCIVTQESTFAFPINNYLFIVDWLMTNKDIIFHTHMYKDGALYNVALHIQHKKIVNVYYKQRLIPFVECFPQWLAWSKPVDYSCFSNHGEQPCYFNVCNQLYRPLICSDIFIESFKDRLDNVPKIPLYNDMLFSADYLYIMKAGCKMVCRTKTA